MLFAEYVSDGFLDCVYIVHRLFIIWFVLSAIRDDDDDVCV